MTLYTPTDKWTDATVDIPNYGILQKSHILDLSGWVESFLLNNGLVKRFKQSDATPVVEEAPAPLNTNKQPPKKGGQQTPINTQESPTE